MIEYCKRCVPTKKGFLIIGLFILTVGTGMWAMQERKNERLRLSCLSAVNELRLETRAKIRSQQTNKDSVPQSLTELGVATDNGRDIGKYTVLLSQNDSHDVLVTVHKRGRPDRVCLKTTYDWTEWTGAHFELAWQ